MTHEKSIMARIRMIAFFTVAVFAATMAQADTPHGLTALAERAGTIPWDLLHHEDGLNFPPVVFHDRNYGTEVWMLAPSPLADHSFTGSVQTPWNADGSIMSLRTRRPNAEGAQQTWDWHVDDARWHTAPFSGRPIRDPDNLHILYHQDETSLTEYNRLTGASRLIATWEPYPRQRAYGMTADRRYIFLDTPNAGIWVRYEPGDEPIPKWNLYDGRPASPRPDGSATHPREDNEFVYRGHAAVADSAEWGPLIRLRVGVLIDRQSGAMENVIAPASLNRAYLRTYLGENGRIHFPQWEDYRIHTADSEDELAKIHLYYPAAMHGHESPSPDRQYIVADKWNGAPVKVYHVPSGDIVAEVTASRDGGHYHQHWMRHPRFFLGYVFGWRFGTYRLTEHNPNLVYQGFVDGTWQPVFTSHQRFSGYYHGGDFSLLSPDATKVHTASAMMGRPNHLIAFMARPRPPQHVTWQAEEDGIALAWQPPLYADEIRGYLVYRSDRSGEGYALVTPQPVRDTMWRDDTIERGRDYYYVVVSVEATGPQSGHSPEASRAGIDLPQNLEAPIRIYLEAERAVLDLPTDAKPGLSFGYDRETAGDWGYLYRHPDTPRGQASQTFTVPVAGEYHLWLRVRQGEADQPAQWQVRIDDHSVGEAAAKDTQWHWVRAGRVTLDAADHDLVSMTQDAAAQLDAIWLTSDERFTPRGGAPEDRTIPSSVHALEGENVRDRVNRLTWQAETPGNFSHFNVYASRDSFDKPEQRHRVGSPRDALFIDWGLRGGERYHYGITVVDRLGNESPMQTVTIQTPEPAHPAFVQMLTFDAAELHGDFEKSKAKGTLGEHYVVPHEQDDHRASWTIDVPHDDSYYLWLRFLQRGSGGRGDTIWHRINVLVNDEASIQFVGSTDLHVPDAMLDTREPHVLAEQFWTWQSAPGGGEPVSIALPAGRHTLILKNLHPSVRYDALLLTNEPAWQPGDGRLRLR